MEDHLEISGHLLMLAKSLELEFICHITNNDPKCVGDCLPVGEMLLING